MYDPQLKKIVRETILSIQNEMSQMAPFMAGAVDRWVKQLARTPNPEDYYLHPKAFPMLLLPWWMEETFRPSPDIAFQSAVIYSSISGYYYTRLVDNLMDEGGEEERRLLPAAHFFLYQSQMVYYPYFQAGHFFWWSFLNTLVQAGETAMRDAGVVDIDLAIFREVSAQKICGAKIPIAAVGYYHNQTDLIDPWSAFVDLFGCWHQMTDDIFDWHQDLQLGSPTYFLSEGKRQVGAAVEDVAAWVIKDGFDWGCDLLDSWLSDLRKMAQEIQSPSLMAYLDLREELFQKQTSEARRGLKSLAQSLSVIG